MSHIAKVPADEEQPLLSLPPINPESYETRKIGGRELTVNKFVEGPGFIDDEQFIETMTSRKEEQATVQALLPEIDQLVWQAILCNGLFLFYLIVLMITELSIVHFYHHPETNGKYIILVWIIISLTVLVTISGIRFAVPQLFRALRRSIVSDILGTLFTILGALGLYLYLDRTITAQSAVYFFIPQVVSTLFDFVLMALIPNYTTLSAAIPNFLAAMQNLIFVLNIAYFHSNEWSLILLLYLIAGVVILIYSSIMAVFTFVMFFVWLFKFRVAFDDYIISLFAGSFFVFLSGIGFFAFFTFIGVRRLLETGALFVEHPNTSHMDQFLYHVAIACLVFLVIIFVWNFITQFFVIRKVRSKYMYKKTNRKVWYYKEPLLMDMVLMSKDYFKRRDEVRDGEGQGERVRLERCLVCETRMSNCVLYPCGHTGFCIECFREDQKKRDSCMICKQAVFKAKRVHFDDDDEVYLSGLEERYS